MSIIAPHAPAPLVSDVVAGTTPAGFVPQNGDSAAYFVAQQPRDAATALALHLLQSSQHSNGSGPLLEWLYQQPAYVELTPTSATLLLLASRRPELRVHLALAGLTSCPSCWEVLRHQHPQLALPVFPGGRLSSGFCAPHVVAIRGVA